MHAAAWCSAHATPKEASEEQGVLNLKVIACVIDIFDAIANFALSTRKCFGCGMSCRRADKFVDKHVSTSPDYKEQM